MLQMAGRPRAPRSCKGARELPATFWFEVPKSCTGDIHTHPRNSARGCARKKRITSTPAVEDKRSTRCLFNAPYTDPSAFPFFELPLELRDQVYSYLVVAKDPYLEPMLDATTIQRNRKKRLAAENARNRLNQKRLAAGKQVANTRHSRREPSLHLNILCASQRLYAESTRLLYNNNRFRLSLAKLPLTVFETPYGWDLARIMRLDLNLQIKDALRMDRHVDWSTFFSTFPALRFLRISPSFHPRYYEWAHEELRDWKTAHYVHKAFFRELIAAIPDSVQFQWGDLADMRMCEGIQNDLLISQAFLEDMYACLKCKRA